MNRPAGKQRASESAEKRRRYAKNWVTLVGDIVKKKVSFTGGTVQIGEKKHTSKGLLKQSKRRMLEGGERKVCPSRG